MGAEEFLKPDVRTMDPWVVIKQSADAMGIRIQKPKNNCKRCHGRGWIGRRSDTGEPIPCNCIFPKETYDREIGLDETYIKPRNRAERRKKRV